MSSLIKLRPHHSLCIQFFVGKGYSETFTAHMSKTIAFLEESNPQIVLTDGCDVICARCPNNINGACISEDKVKRIDQGTLKKTGFNFGKNLDWRTLKKAAYDNIIGKGCITSVCAGCQWIDLCFSSRVR